ncbi:hypothetical protein N2152v2_005938 [Parachlorella kessleri]
MVYNLLKQKYRVVLYDKNQEAVERLCKHGAQRAASPAEVAARPGLEALVSMLPSSQAALEAYLGSDGVLRLQAGELRPHVLIDCSTIDPITSQELSAAAEGTLLHAEAAQAHDAQYPRMIDAPVSGGVAGAEAGTLTFMCGGSAAAMEAAEPYLMRLGRHIIHCGPHGSGQAAKVCNNLVLGVTMAGLSEGLALGRRLGLDPQLLSQIFNISSARCWSSEVYNPCPGVQEGVPSSRGYRNGFNSSLMVKDLGLAIKAAQHCGAPLPMADQAVQLYRQVMEKDPTLDFSAVFEAVYGGEQDGKK